jgi:hypothetical protein
MMLDENEVKARELASEKRRMSIMSNTVDSDDGDLGFESDDEQRKRHIAEMPHWSRSQ